jgi:hypothetical protein
VVLARSLATPRCRHSKEETGRPLQRVVEAMIRNLGAGEMHVYMSMSM